jgi:hypothetical protein
MGKSDLLRNHQPWLFKLKKAVDSDCLWIEVEIKGNEQGIKCIGISTIYWNSPRLLSIKRFNDRSKGEKQRVKDGGSQRCNIEGKLCIKVDPGQGCRGGFV